MLSDCHIHMVLDGVWWKDAIARHKAGVDEGFVRKTLADYQSRGITYLRDGGDRWGVCDLAAKLAPEYGISYKMPCFPICKAGHYGTFIGRTFETLADFKALVQEVKNQGGDFIKIMISGIMDFDRYGAITSETLPAQEIKDMIAISHDAGFSVMAHANGDAAVLAAVEGGIDSVEHGAYLADETVSALAESQTVWVPTLVTIANLIGCGRYPDTVLKPLLANQLRLVKLAGEKGAYLAPGSDAGAYRVYHGQGCLDEYALLHQVLGEKTDEILERGIKKLQEKF